jgi:hypothetical protein
VGPLWLVGVLTLGNIRMARMNPDAMWTALFWFRLSTAAYFGFGNLVPIFSNPETLTYLEAFFFFQSGDIATLNVLVAASVLAVLGTAALMPLFAGKTRTNTAPQRGSELGRDILYFGLAFYVAGAAVKYLVLLPFQLGSMEETLAGSIGALSAFTFVGMYLLSAWSFERARYMLPVLLALLTLDFAVGLLTFAKQEPMFLLLMFLLGMLRRGVTLVRLTFALLLVSVSYLAITPIVAHSRQVVMQRHGSPASLSERLYIASSYFTEGASLTTAEEALIDFSSVRLSYVNQATFAIRMYDAGVPSGSLDHLLATLIPRFLWPDKPIITQIGVDFNFAATGSHTSSAAPGLFADAYWNFGWSGVGLLMIPLGAILGYISIFALDVMRQRRWIYFPLILIGMRLGLRTDGFIVADIVGTLVIMGAGYAILTLLEPILVAVFRQRISA